MNKKYYFGSYSIKIGKLFILTDEYSLYRVAFSHSTIMDFFKNYLMGQKLSDTKISIIKRTKSQIRRYFEGECPYYFSIPLNLTGTRFQKAVWREIEKIPYGETKSYSDIATELGDKNMARAVGGACAKNPIPLIIPCHRVIRSDGDLGGYSAGLDYKKALLSLENNYGNQ